MGTPLLAIQGHLHHFSHPVVEIFSFLPSAQWLTTCTTRSRDSFSLGALCSMGAVSQLTTRTDPSLVTSWDMQEKELYRNTRRTSVMLQIKKKKKKTLLLSASNSSTLTSSAPVKVIHLKLINQWKITKLITFTDTNRSQFCPWPCTVKLYPTQHPFWTPMCAVW